MKTLFYDTPTIIQTLSFAYSLNASEEFINCADQQLTAQFIKETGIKPGKNVCFSIAPHTIESSIYSNYIRPDNFIGRKMEIKLYVNHHWNPITIFWKSKSNKDYKLHDSNIDPNDIEFYFEKLDKELYLSQLYPNDKLPFIIGKLTFKLEVIQINVNCCIEMNLRTGKETGAEHITKDIDQFIADYNIKSEVENGKRGVIHHSKTFVIGASEIKCELDLGSTGPHFLEQFLGFLSGLDSFSMIKIY